MANNLGDLQDSGTLVPNTTATVNGATTASTSVVIASANPNLFVGQTVTGFGVPNANGITGATKIATISADGLTLTLSNPATLVDKTVLTFSSIYAPVCTTTVNGAISSATNSVTIVANTLIAAGQIVSGVGIQAATVTAPNTVNNNSTTTTLVLNTATSASVADKAVLTFWAPVTSNVVTDFVWKNLPLQPNDDRATGTAVNYVASGVQTAKITTASTDGKVTTFTTDVDHGLVVGSVVNTGTYAVGGTVASPTAGTTVLSESVNAIATATATSVTANVAANTNVTIPSTANLVVGMVVTASGGTVTTLAAGTTIATVTNNTTIQLSSAINVSGTTLTFAYTPTVADSTQKTVTINTPTNKFVVGQVVGISGGTSANSNAIYNGSFTVLARTATSITIANANTPTEIKDTLAIAATPFDLVNATVLSVNAAAKTFTVASGPVSSSSSASTVTASLEVVGDSSLFKTTTANVSSRYSFTKVTDGNSKDRLVISNTINGNTYETPVYDGLIVDSGWNGYPNYNTGKYLASAASVGSKAGSAYLYITAPNNFADYVTFNTTKVNLTGFSNSLFNFNGAVIQAANPDGFVVKAEVTTQASSGTISSATKTITLSAANNAIAVGQAVYNSTTSLGKVTAISGTTLTIDTDVSSLSNNTSLSFIVPLGTTVSGQSALVQLQNWGVANYNVTAVTVDATTNTTYKYTAQNNFQVGDKVTVTGLVSNSVLSPNISNVSVATATATYFTVTGQTASTLGYTLTGQVGKAEYTTAAANVDGGYSGSTFGYLVPNVIGRTADSAKDAFADRGITASKGNDSSKASKTADGVWRTAGSALTQIYTSTTHGLVAGDVFTSASNTGVADGEYTVLYVIDTSNFMFVSNSTAVQTTASGGSGTVIGKVGTVHSTTPAGNSRSTDTTATYSLWA